MDKTKRIMLIAAVAMMLGAASTAQATYCEKWTRPIGQGSITYNSKTYYLRSGDGYLWCVEKLGNPCPTNWDRFLPGYTDWTAIFTTDGNRDTLNFVDSTYSTHTNWGCKQTGQTGTKEGYGDWCAYDTKNRVFFWGTWDTELGDQYFDYGTTPPWVHAGWYVVQSSDDADPTGSGEWSGMRLVYEASCQTIP